MIRLVMLACVAVFVVSQEMSFAEPGNWPQFRGPTGQGTSDEKGLPVKWSADENVVWKIEMPGPGTSSPIIYGSKIFITYYTGFNVPGQRGPGMEDLKLHVMCLERDGGKKLWTKTIDPKLPEQAKIREDHGYASSTPAADAEQVYVFFGKTGVFAFDHAGEEKWRADVGDRIHGWGSAASPILVGDLVIINASVESDSVIAFNKKTGREEWRVRNVKESWNTPVLAPLGEKTELVVAKMGKILGLDPKTGDELWNCDTDITWYMVPSLIVNDGIVYALGGRSGVASLAVKAGGRGDVTKSHRLWTSKKGSNVTSPLFHEGRLYWMNDTLGMAFCADAKTGDVIYDQRIPRADQVYGSPILADGRIYYTSRSGQTYVVAAKPEYELLATNNLGDRSMFNSSPAASGGRIYLRSDKFLYCLGQK